MYRDILQKHPDRIEEPLAISLGGTGQKTASLALAALNGTPVTAINTVDGPVPLNASNKIPPTNLPNIQPVNINQFSIVVPGHFHIGGVSNIIITDYDNNKPLTITTSIGTLAPGRFDDYINQSSLGLGYSVGIYIPFDTDLIGQICEININGDILNIPIVNSEFIFNSGNSDVIVEPNIVTIGVNIDVNGFPPSLSNGGLSHDCTVRIKAEISTNNTFNVIEETLLGIVIESPVEYIPDSMSGDYETNNNNYKSYNTTWQPTLPNTHFYCRYRLEYIYHDVNNNIVVDYVSNWKIVDFTTQASIPSAIYNRIFDNDSPFNSSLFALGDYSVSMSDDGKMFVVNNQVDNNRGLQFTKYNDPYPMIYTGLSFAMPNPSIFSPYNPSGVVSTISGDGKNIFLFAQSVSSSILDGARYKIDTNGNLSYGGGFIYFGLTLGTNPSGWYGAVRSICTNYDGTVLCIKQDNPSHRSDGKDMVFVFFLEYNQSGDMTIVDTQIITVDLLDPEQSTGFYFGLSMAISSSGNTLVIGNYDDQPSTGNVLGAAYVLERTQGQPFTLTQKIVPTSHLYNNMRFGQAVDISKDGSTIAVSEVIHYLTGEVLNGVVRTYRKPSTNWVEDGYISFPNSSNISSSGFGWSLKLTANGDSLVIGAPYSNTKNPDNSYSNERTGCVFYFVRDTNSQSGWALAQEYYEILDIAGAELGRCVCISNNGTIVAASCPKAASDTGDMYDHVTTRNVLVFT